MLTNQSPVYHLEHFVKHTEEYAHKLTKNTALTGRLMGRNKLSMSLQQMQTVMALKLVHNALNNDYEKNVKMTCKWLL